MTSLTNHVTPDQISGLLEDTLPPAEQTIILQHLDECPTCMQLLLERRNSESLNATPLFGLNVDGGQRHPDYRSSLARKVQEAASGKTASRADATAFIHSSLTQVSSLGTGGFGHVFVYQEDRFRRPVAVKMLQDRWIGSPEIVSRFRREMEITALIDHPGCPAVYGSGQTSDGRDFFWMQLVTGKPLSELIASAHTSGKIQFNRHNAALRDLLRLFQQICEVIDVAHGKGIWHRDLKPANIRQHENNFPVVLDWGLAAYEHRQEPSTSSTSNSAPDASDNDLLTQAGDQPGTIGYMSPEAARGDIARINKSTDIYGLGGILYEILTGHAPHSSLLKEGKTPKEVLPILMNGRVPQFDGLPSELISICRKALALQQNDRYLSAGDLSRDVDRWLSGEPVSAHDYGILGKAMLVVRRRPIATSVSTLVAATVAILVLLGSQWRSEATQQRAVAERRFELALNAWETLVDEVQEELSSTADSSMRKKLLQQAAEAIRQLVADAGNQPGAELVVIRGQLKLAQIQEEEDGEYRSALSEYERLRTRILALDMKDNLPARYELLGDATQGIINCLLKLEGTTAAEPWRNEFQALASEAITKLPKEISTIRLYAQARLEAGQSAEAAGPDFYEKAVEHFKEAEAALLSLPVEERQKPAVRVDILSTQSEQVRLLRIYDDSDAALKIQDQIVTRMRELASSHPSKKNRIGLVHDEMQLGYMLKDRSPEEAVKQLQSVRDSIEQLQMAYPEDQTIEELALDVSSNLATALRADGRPGDAVELLKKLVNLDVLNNSSEADIDQLEDQAFVLAAYGSAYVDLDKTSEAIECYQDAIRTRRLMHERDPNNIQNLKDLLNISQAWADHCEQRDEQTVSTLKDLCQIADGKNAATAFGPKMKKTVAILHRWYGEHALLVAQQQGSLSLATQAKQAYERSRQLLSGVDGIPESVTGELDAKLFIVDGLIQSLKSESP